MDTRISLPILLLSLLSLTACQKDSGLGGTSTIRGKVWTREYNKTFTVQKTPDFPATKEDVFIIYGDDEVYSDKYATNYDGIFEFKYLREGRYTVYVYSKDSTLDYNNTSQKKIISREVEITGKDQVVEVPDMVVLDASGSGGTSTIRGKVWIREYNKDFTIQKVPDYPAQELRVYIIYGDNDFYSDDTRTSYNGIFEFKDLVEGKYTVFVYSKDSTLNYDYTSQMKIVSGEAEITENYQLIDLPDMVVLK